MNELRDIHMRLLMLESLLNDIYDTLDIKLRICPVCGHEFKIYLPFGNKLRKNAQCPYCLSLERQRTMWMYFRDQIKIFSDTKSKKILHFGPEVTFNNQFSKMKNYDYYPVDYDPNFEGIREVVDMQNIKHEDKSFDIIICNHVLEHIPDESKALKELQRVLKNEGVIYLTVPIDYSMENTLENDEYDTEELRLKYYGDLYHVRKYGKDFYNRLKNSGLNVEIIEPNINFNDKELIFFGLDKYEQIFKCSHKNTNSNN